MPLKSLFLLHKQKRGLGDLHHSTARAIAPMAVVQNSSLNPICICSGSRARVAWPKFVGTVALVIVAAFVGSALFNTTADGFMMKSSTAKRKFVLLNTLKMSAAEHPAQQRAPGRRDGARRQSDADLSARGGDAQLRRVHRVHGG